MNTAARCLILTVFLLLLTTFFFVGCSSEGKSVTAPQTSPPEQVQNTDQPSNNPYPVLTDEQIEHLIPGFQVLSVDAHAQGRDNTLDDQASRLIRRTQGGTVSHRNNGVEIGAWQLREDQTVTVSTPNPGRAIIDYYPHPYHFNGCIRIWLDLNCIVLPQGRRWDELAFFFQDENGQLVRYWGVLDLNAHTYSAWPDHFSRYIISLPSN